jgi:hypothetical protein
VSTAFLFLKSAAHIDLAEVDGNILVSFGVVRNISFWIPPG